MAMAKVLPIEDITKEDFEAYEAVRSSGVVNMFSPQVCELAGFSKDTHVTIIKHYAALNEKWPDVRGKKKQEAK